jgi:hypothetical protein
MPNSGSTTTAGSTTTMMGGRRKAYRKGTRKGRGSRRGTRRMRGGQVASTLSVPAAMPAMPAASGAAPATAAPARPMMGGAKVTVGSKAQVWHGTAHHTSGGLVKKDLMKHKGRIVSKKKHALGKKAFKKLVAAGYKPKKGTFKLFRK